MKFKKIKPLKGNKTNPFVRSYLYPSEIPCFFDITIKFIESKGLEEELIDFFPNADKRILRDWLKGKKW